MTEKGLANHSLVLALEISRQQKYTWQILTKVDAISRKYQVPFCFFYNLTTIVQKR